MTTAQPIEPGRMRVGDAERERMAERLAQAHAAGQLRLDEFDDRVQQAYQARVRSDLDALVVDLPSEYPDLGRGARLDANVQQRADAWRGGRSGAPAEGRSSNDQHAPSSHTPCMDGRVVPPHWRDGPAHWRGGAAQSQRGGAMRGVWIMLAVLVGLWLLVGPMIGFLFNVAFTALIIAGIVTLVGRFRDHHR